jgi:hypothetical protein
MNLKEESLITALEEDLIYDDHGYLPTSDSDDEDLEPTTPKKKRKTTSSTYVGWGTNAACLAAQGLSTAT